MTEAEKRAEASIACWLGTLHPEITDPPSLARAFLTALEEAGLQITTRPERKPLPDAPGWWWVRFEGWRQNPPRDKTVMCRVKLRNGHLMLKPYAWAQPGRVDDLGNIAWAIGPLPVPGEE